MKRPLLRRLLPVVLLPLLLFSLVGCTVAPADTVFVTEVIDGDTIILAGGERVRYIGIDTPEMRPQPEPFAKQATEANRALVEGKSVRLERDVSETDRYDRLLRYVWVDGKMVNTELLKMGLATAKAYPPDTRYQAYFAVVEAEAKAAGRGMWAK